jgi:flagellar basal-body rod protein FlgG
MRAQELMIDVTANNLANVNTNGFKRSQVDFADLVYLTTQQAGTEVADGQPTPVGIQVGSGVRPMGTTKLFTTGVLEPTGGPLDVAIQGDGFFKITLPGGGERFTRDGAFRTDANGQLVTLDGYLIEGAPTIPPNVDRGTIRVGSNGTITGVDTAAGGGVQTLGTISLHRFSNPEGLSSEGGNLYAETAASGPATQGEAGTEGLGTILQGHLERSNVQVVTELVALIRAQRAYEINSRAIRAGDEMLSVTSQIVS